MAVGYQPIREISEKYFGERPLKEVTYDYSINGGAILAHLAILAFLAFFGRMVLSISEGFFGNPWSLGPGMGFGPPSPSGFFKVPLTIMGLVLVIIGLGTLHSLVVNYRKGLAQLARVRGFFRADSFLRERGSDRYFVHPADNRILFNEDFLIYKGSFLSDSLVPYKELDLEEDIRYEPATKDSPAQYVLTFTYGPRFWNRVELDFDNRADAAFLQEVFWKLKEDHGMA